LYSRNYTDDFEHIDVNLLTPFFSAIFSFSQNLISRKLEELEMSGLRFVFRIEEKFIFVILADTSVSTLFISSCLKRISDIFSQFYNQLEDDLKEYKEIDNLEFDDKVISIISGQEEIFKSRKFYEKVISYFNNLIFENEILGAALLSTKGNIIYSSLPDKILLNSLRELEIRFSAGALTLPEMYYALENGQKLFSKIIEHKRSQLNFFIVIFFEKSVPLGMAEVHLIKISKQLIKLLEIYT
ncbi:MAG: hypothetical protein ACTSQJ_06790, partial [Promethearchaeota archaeon]